MENPHLPYTENPHKRTIPYTTHPTYPYQYKMEAYNHIIHRLNNIPMNQNDYLQELETIKYIAGKDGYNTQMIDRMNRNYRNKQQLRYSTTLLKDNDESKRYITIDYNNKTSNVMQKVLHSQGYKTAFRTVNKVAQKLNNTNNTVEDTGIYKITCNECPAFYIGQTGRDFKTRFHEHIKDINKQVIKSNYAEHLVKQKHTYTGYDENLHVIQKCRKGPMMDRIEELEIYKNKDNIHLLNDKINTKPNRIYDMIISNTKQ